MVMNFRKYFILVLALSFFGCAGCGGETAVPESIPPGPDPAPGAPAPPVKPLEKPATVDGIDVEDAEFVEGEDLPPEGSDGLMAVTLSPFSMTREGEAVITLRITPGSPPADNSASGGRFLVATAHNTIERVLFDVTVLDRECYHRRTGRVDYRGIGTTEQVCKEQSSYKGYFNARYLSSYRGVRVSFGEAFFRWYRRNSTGGVGEEALLSFVMQLQFEDGTYSNRIYSPDIVLEDLEEFISEPIALIRGYTPSTLIGEDANIQIDFVTAPESNDPIQIEEDITLNYSVAIYLDGKRLPESFEYKRLKVLSGEDIIQIHEGVPRYKSLVVWSLLDGEGYKAIDRALDGVDKVEMGKRWNIDVSRNGICDYGCVVIQALEEEPEPEPEPGEEPEDGEEINNCFNNISLEVCEALNIGYTSGSGWKIDEVFWQPGTSCSDAGFRCQGRGFDDPLLSILYPLDPSNIVLFYGSFEEGDSEIQRTNTCLNENGGAGVWFDSGNGSGENEYLDETFETIRGGLACVVRRVYERQE